MLATKLSRAQLELQAHRVWLRSFNLRRSAAIAFTSTIPPSQARLASTNSRPDGRNANRRGGLVQKIYTERRATPSGQEDAIIVALQRQINDASEENDFDSAMGAYRSIEDKRLLLSYTLSKFTRYISLWTKSQESLPEDKRDRDMNDRLQQYVGELANDVRNGTLLPSPTSNAHILQYYTAARIWDAGAEFWSWLDKAGNEHIDGKVYAAAIDMLAAQDTKLEDLEAMYQQALERLPVGFATYHFTSGAVVQDREKHLPLYRFPDDLFSSIMAARLMRGDAQNAYLTLDSMLMLKPTTTLPRFFNEYQNERPIAEAYTVFALACRGGTKVPVNHFRTLLSLLRNNADVTDGGRYAQTVRAMFSATFLYIGGGGRINRNAVTELIIVLANMLRIAGIDSLAHEQKAQLVEKVQEMIRKVLELATRFGAIPTIAAFNTIIVHLARLGNAEDIITAAMHDAQALGLEPTIVTRRSIIVAAGESGDAELLAKGWRWLTEARARDDQYPDTTDLHVLIKACMAAGKPELAREAIEQMTHLDKHETNNALYRLSQGDTSAEPGPPADLNTLLAEFSNIQADLEVFDEKTSDAATSQDFSTQQVPMLLFSPPKEVRLPEAEMRKLYDELSTDPNASQPQEPAEPDVARVTNIPYGQLRYESWKYITYLLAEAERHDQAYIRAVDAAIARGARPPQRGYGELFIGEKIGGIGLSDAVQEFGAEGQKVDVEKARAKICELRKVPVPKEQEVEA